MRRPAVVRRPLRRGAAVPAVLVLLAVALVAVVPSTAGAQDLEQVVEEREQLEDRVAAATAAYEDLVARLAAAEEQLATLEQQVADLEREVAETRDALVGRVRSAFMRGDGDLFETVLAADGPEGALERAQLLAAITSRDRGRLEGAQNLHEQLAQTRTLLEDRRAELDDLQEQLAANRDTLEAELGSIRAQERELRSRRERQRTIARGVQNGTYACIIASPYHFRDTWGAPRSGGRRHKGTDVMGLMRAPVYAFTNGRVSRVSHSRLGGLGLYLWGDDGVEYYYAHLNSVADGAWVGKRVEAGELVAYNGASGNARGGAPHVHFEVHPGGGGWTNPYPWLAPACF